MTAKEYLQQIRAIKERVQIAKEEVETIEAKLGAQAINYSADPKGQGDTEKQAHLIYRLIDAKDKLIAQQLELTLKEAEIRDKLFELKDGKEIQVLYLRYFKLLKFNEIAEQMCYSDRRIRELHYFGLLDLQDKL